MSEAEQPSDYTLKKSKIKLVNKELSVKGNTDSSTIVKYNTIEESNTHYIICK